MRATIGWNATLRQNTYEQLTTENPYMLSNYQVIQTRQDEIYAHLEGNVGNHISWTGKVSWWNSFDMPTFLNDTGDQKEFYVLYQNVKALSFQFGARYQMASKWSVGANADFYNFYYSTDQHVWHQPSTRIKADVTVSPTAKLNFSAYAYVLGGINARDTGFNAVKLKTIADIGLNAEYTIVPRLSAFVQFNNLLNSKYQRWQGYEVYGFNIYGGLRLKF
jgi:outer membrane receptor protein involved in Fe transport